jgi:hypothetical protein
MTLARVQQFGTRRARSPAFMRLNARRMSSWLRQRPKWWIRLHRYSHWLPKFLGNRTHHAACHPSAG